MAAATATVEEHGRRGVAATTLAERPVEILSGVVMVVVGVGVTAASAENVNAVGVGAGGILTALGGVLLSWVFSVVVGRRQGLHEVRRQLDAVSRALGQASGQITQAVEDAAAGVLPQETALEIIATSAKAIYGQVNEIQVMLGNRFDSQALLATVTALDDMAKQLSSRSGSVGRDLELDELRARLNEMRLNLEQADYPRTVSTVVVECPECGVPNPVRLGDYGGATIRVSCERCDAPFNAHRKQDGTAFARPAGPVATRSRRSGNKQLRFACPSCDKDIGLSADPDEDVVLRACFACNAKLQVNVSTSTAEQRGRYEIIEVRTVSGWTNGRPELSCDGCDRRHRAIFRMGDRHYAALCNTTDTLLRIPVDEAQRWRDS